MLRKWAIAVLAGLVLVLLVGGLFSGQGEPERASEASPTAPRRNADIIDVHVHLSPAAVPRLLDLMRRHGVSHIVNLSGGGPLTGLDEQLAAAARAPGKIVVFTTLAYEQARFPDYGQRMAELVRI